MQPHCLGALLTGFALFSSLEMVEILKASGLVDRDRETAQDSCVHLLQKFSPPMIIEGKGSSESPFVSEMPKPCGFTNCMYSAGGQRRVQVRDDLCVGRHVA